VELWDMAFNHTFLLLLFFFRQADLRGIVRWGGELGSAGKHNFFLFHDGRGRLCCLLFSLSFWAFFLNFFFVFPGSA